MTTTLLTIAICVSGGLAAADAKNDLRFAQQVRAMGETAKRLARAYERLDSPPLNDPVFVLSDVSFELTRRFTEYSGDISGRMLSALETADPVLDRQAKIIPDLLAGFAKYQKPDGHFGADQDLDKQVNQQRDMPILWGNGRLMFALARHCLSHPDPEALKMARRLGDYICSTRKYYGKEENFRNVGGFYASGFTTCYPSMVDGLVALAEASGDTRYADEARFIAKLSLLDDAFAKHHSHGRLTTYRGMLELDHLAGTRDFVEKVRGYCAKIAAELELPTGGVTELFDRDYRLDEGCTEADWLWVNLLLWRATGEAAFLDAADHTLRNHILAAQFPNGGFGHRTLRDMKDGGKTWYGGGFEPVGTEAYWCCSMHGAQALAEAGRYGVVTQGDKIIVSWLAEVAADVRIGDRTVHVVTERTGPCTWQVRVESSKPGDVTFRLRVPGWAKTIDVDDKPSTGKDGWTEVVRHLDREQVFHVYFPQEVRLAGVYSREPAPGEPVRIFVGPDMYCLPDVQLGKDILTGNEVPAVVLAAEKPVGGTLPVAIEGAGNARQQAALVPLATRPIGGCRHLFKVRRVERATFDELAGNAANYPQPGPPVTFTFTCDGEFQLLLNGRDIAHGAGANAEQIHEAYASRGANVLTVRVRSKAARPGLIGVIRVAEKLHVTDTANWVASGNAASQPAEWMTDPKADVPKRLKLDDLGAWGCDPWKHVTAQYAGTGAHWVWPADYKSPAWYAVRYVFTIP